MRIFKKVWRIATTVLVVIAVILAVLLVGGRFVGNQIYTVLSASMEPHFMTGSIIYVVKTDPQKLEVGDVITFRLSGGTPATHRIIEVLGEGNSLQFRTKGDNNDVEDGSPVAADNVLGKAIFSIPYMGYVITYIQQPPWCYVAIAAGAGILLLMMLPELLSMVLPKSLFDVKKRKEGNKNEKDN